MHRKLPYILIAVGLTVLLVYRTDFVAASPSLGSSSISLSSGSQLAVITQEGHLFTNHDRFLVHCLVSETCATASGQGLQRIVTVHAHLENERVRRGYVNTIQACSENKPDPVSLSIAPGDYEYSVSVQPAVGLNWGDVAAPGDILMTFNEVAAN